ncbi:MAG: SRPBCC domain-containing protein [Candidatus Nanopelagicales bacterium]
MSVTSVQKDPEKLTMTITAEYGVSVERAWELWSDPRQLERWWGPPTYPATVVEHNLVPGGTITYFMTGPEGDTPGGMWNVLEVEAPTRLVVEDAFVDDAGNPMEDMPRTVMQVHLAERPGGGVIMSIESKFPSLEAMQQLTEMGMDEGMKLAMGQIDGILAG